MCLWIYHIELILLLGLIKCIYYSTGILHFRFCNASRNVIWHTYSFCLSTLIETLLATKWGFFRSSVNGHVIGFAKLLNNLLLAILIVLFICLLRPMNFGSRTTLSRLGTTKLTLLTLLHHYIVISKLRNSLLVCTAAADLSPVSLIFVSYQSI